VEGLTIMWGLHNIHNHGSNIQISEKEAIFIIKNGMDGSRKGPNLCCEWYGVAPDASFIDE